MSVRLIAGSTAWQLASQLVMAALSILTVKFVAIGLSKELAGNYNSAYGYLQLFGILADFGLYAFAVRELAASKHREETLGTLAVIRIITVVLSFGLALILAWSIPGWRSSPLSVGITIAATVPVFTLLAGILRTVFQVTYKMHFVFIAEVGQRILTAGCIGAFIFYGIRSSTDTSIYNSFLAIGGIGAAFLLLASLVASHRLIPLHLHFDRVFFQKVLRSAFPYGIAFLCIAIYRQLDVTLIALLRPDYEIQNAYYGFVLRMTEMGYLIPTFLLNSTLPLLSERASPDGILKKVFLIILTLGSISALFSLFWARPLIELMTTSSYLATADHAGSDTALALLSIPLFLNGIILMSFYSMLSRHHWKSLVISMLIGATVSIVLNILLIPRFGFIGATYTSITVHILLALLLWPQSQKILPVRMPMEWVLRWLSFTVLFAAILFLFKPFLTSMGMTIIGLGLMSIMMLMLLNGCGYRSMLIKSPS